MKQGHLLQDTRDGKIEKDMALIKISSLDKKDSLARLIRIGRFGGVT
jgi:hypothetical protein